MTNEIREALTRLADACGAIGLGYYQSALERKVREREDATALVSEIRTAADAIDTVINAHHATRYARGEEARALLTAADNAADLYDAAAEAAA